MKMLNQAAMAMVLAVGSVGLAQAHHAANSQFNSNQSLAFTGVLQRYSLANPHTYLYFVRTANGHEEQWAFETVATIALRRAGLSARDSWKIGDTYTIVYSPALDGSDAGLMTAMKLADGRIIALAAKEQVDPATKLLNEKLLNGHE